MPTTRGSWKETKLDTTVVIQLESRREGGLDRNTIQSGTELTLIKGIVQGMLSFLPSLFKHDYSYTRASCLHSNLTLKPSII